ncbi:MAG TPA: LysR family transcriptional regulator [Tepidisphaeraceae bacterium]|nr:LysR family transcriptional regulator [Tepidisphaeraceae bacterium]
MDIRQLAYFVATVEAGTVSRAAARVGVAQPSLSQQLKSLEDSLGVRLFDRLPRGMTPTEAGRALLPRARRILAEAADLEQNLKRESKSTAGILAVGAIPTIAPYVLPHAIASVVEARRGCEVTVREDLTENVLEALLDCQIECALIATQPDDDRIAFEHLRDEELVVVAPASMRWASAELRLTDLRDQPTISLHEMHCLGRRVDVFCELRRLRPRVVCKMTQLSTILKLVSLGLGVSVVPEMTAAVAREPGCAYSRLRGERPVRPLGIAWRKGRRRSAVAMNFATAVQGLLASDRLRMR